MGKKHEKRDCFCAVPISIVKMTYKVASFAIIPLLLPRMGPSVTDRISGAALGIVAATDARASERFSPRMCLGKQQAPSAIFYASI
jgi:hypothetical protein